MFARIVSAAVVSIVGAGAVTAAPWPSCGRVSGVPGTTWTETDPAALGWSAAKLAEAKAVFAAQPSAAVVVVHQGRLVAQWGSVEKRYTAQSVRKALVNSLVGMLVDQRRLRSSDTLATLGIDDREPALTESERRATLQDLMSSRSGIFHTALYEVGGWKKERMALAEEERQAGRDLFPAGAYWIYNNWDFNAVGTVIERAAKREIGPLFGDWIARPLQMEDFRPADVEYTTSDHPAEKRFGNVSDHRAYVFNISTRDLARYGLLYLGCGRWNGRQLVSEAWIRESLTGVDTRIGRPADRQRTGFGDYGYLWQIDRPGARRFEMLETREPYYIASGARGHAMLVMPYLDLVIAHQVATEGGVGVEAQMRRATQGSPEVTDEQFQKLVAAIIAAHPEGVTAFAD
jgi:CubicO group peptidase (beta-lactamase class C family)